jgi:hypothetical protein
MNTTGAAIRFLDALFRCFLSIDAEHRSDLKRLPKPPRGDDRQALQRFFMNFMSDTMKELCGRHYHTVVAALTAVAFPDLDPPGPETVRERCRMRAV